MANLLITDDVVASARDAVQAADTEVRDLKRRSWTTPEQLTAAVAERTAAEERLSGLLDLQQEQVTASAARQEREAQAVGEIDQWEAELESSRLQLVALATAAESAMSALLAHADTHDARVAQVRKSLAEWGLVEEAGRDHQTAAGRMSVRLRGRTWGAVSAVGVLARSVARVIRSACGSSNPYARSFDGIERGTGQHVPAALFDGQNDLTSPTTPQQFTRWVN